MSVSLASASRLSERSRSRGDLRHADTVFEQQMRRRMNRIVSRIAALTAIVIAGLTLSACGYNTIPTLEEQAKARWADVQNQYQRRADLIPNLVSTVQGYAAQEKNVLTAVVEARAKATQIKVDASDLTDPDKIKLFRTLRRN